MLWKTSADATSPAVNSRIPEQTFGAHSSGSKLMWIILVVAVGSTALGRAFTAIHPGYQDALLHAYIGERWLAGDLPYRDIWVNKPPGIFGVAALAFAVTPRSFTALAVVEGVFVLAAVVTVFAIVRTLGVGMAAAGVAAVAASISFNLQFFNERGFLTEQFLLWPASLSMLLFIMAFWRQPRRGSGSVLLAAGGAAGMAALFKPTGLTPLVAQTVFAGSLGILGLRTTRETFRIWALLLSGAVLVWLLPLAYFGSRRAGLALLDASFLFNVRYAMANQPSWPAIILNPVERLAPVAPLVIATAGLAWFSTRRARLAVDPPASGVMTRIPPNAALLVLLWVAFDILGAMAAGRNHPHYYLTALPSLVVATGVAYERLTHSAGQPQMPHAARAMFAALILGPLFLQQASDLRGLAALVRYGAPPPFWKEGADAIVAAGTPESTLFVWDYVPGFYWVTGMTSPSRHLTAPRDLDPNTALAIGSEMLADLRDRAPTFIVDRIEGLAGRAGPAVTYEEFRALLLERYRVMYTSNGRYPGRIWRIAGRPDPG